MMIYVLRFISIQHSIESTIQSNAANRRKQVFLCGLRMDITTDSLLQSLPNNTATLQIISS